MNVVLSAAQMRAIEAGAIEAGAVSGRRLMERAGQGVRDAIFAAWPDLAAAPHKAVVLCGPGNNGGDGFVVARLLKAWGWQVAVFALGDPQKLPPDARANYQRWLEICGARPAVRPLSDAAALAGDAALIVDGLFGTGLTRPLEGLEEVARATQEGRARVVAIDMPSGICADSGRYLRRGPLAPNARFRADLTVSFHAAKLGHHLAEGPAACGRLVVHDIGLPREAPDDAARLVTAPAPGRLEKAQGHKFGHGHALVLSGGAGRSGAARLAARAALRIGAGLVTLGVPGAAQQEVACQITALMLRRVDDPPALAAMLRDRRLNALCLGPGLGVERARALVPEALGPGLRAVLDADALTAFAEAPDTLFAMLHEGVVLTPHGGEFARLFPDLGEALAATPAAGPACSKLDVTRAAARRAGCVVLFKGPDTVIAAPDGRAALHSAHYARAAPWLATAGAGDVLAGIIAGLMARGNPPFAASRLAAWCHVEAARRFGPGLIAEDLPEMLPSVLRGLGAAPG